MALVLGFACALLLSAICMPLILKVAHSRKLYDGLDPRKIHTGNIPRLGGLGIFLSFAIAIGIMTLAVGTGVDTGRRFWVVILFMFVVHLIGLVDDFRNLRAVYKFLVEFAGAVTLAALGFRFMSMPLPFGAGILEFGFWSYPLTVLWIIGVTNALNLIDGMDGLAGGVSALAAAAFGLSFLLNGDRGAALVCFVLVGALFGFLAFNLPPAKIFMGDGGALFLGFTLAILPLIGQVSGKPEIGFVSAVTVLLLPIFDTFAAIVRRSRAGVSAFTPDKLHLHHKLLDLGLSARGALVVIYGAQALLCLIALSGFVLSPWLALVLALATWLAYAGLFVALSVACKRRGRV